MEEFVESHLWQLKVLSKYPDWAFALATLAMGYPFGQMVSTNALQFGSLGFEVACIGPMCYVHILALPVGSTTLVEPWSMGSLYVWQPVQSTRHNTLYALPHIGKEVQRKSVIEHFTLSIVCIRIFKSKYTYTKEKHGV